MEKELTVAEIRGLPEGAKVTVHKTDQYGYPCSGTYFVHELSTGKKVLMNLSPFHRGFMEIRARKGTRFTMEVENGAAE